MRYLILGCGPAGIAAAKAIRGSDKNGEIVIVNEEESAPYLRPLLTDLIAGRADKSALADPQAESLAEIGANVRRGKRAASVDSAKRTVALADGTTESYDVLLVATGGKPVVPPALSRLSAGVLPFDSLADTEKIVARIAPNDTVAVYGPGFLAVTAGAALRKRVREVVWFRPDAPVYGYPISGELEANVLDSVRNTGVRILDGHDIAEARESGGAIELVSTEGGETVRCATVVVATERKPAIDFLAGSGVKVQTGIVVDDSLRTNVPTIFAAGDCAELLDRKSRQSRINFGWRSAIKQGELAGGNMAGAEKLFIRNSEDYFGLLYGSPLAERVA